MSDESGAVSRIRMGAVNLDCRDAAEMAAFYSRLLGWEVGYRDHDFVRLNDPGGGAGISFQEEAWYEPPAWPEEAGKLTKMAHLDLEVDDLEAAVAYAVEVGAEQAKYQPQQNVRVMLDPAGHPFCLYLDD
jgi:catechol 2,3-dioxygenase-like lactoylglutathione lyase family enzyme